MSASSYATGGLVPPSEPLTVRDILLHPAAYVLTPAHRRLISDAERRRIARDNAHGDAWAGLTLLGVWDQKITAEDVGKTLGDLVDEAVR